MKLTKIKYFSLMGILLFMSSCAVDKMQDSEVISDKNDEKLGRNQTGFVYSSEYSNVFNYYHNGVKLTDSDEIKHKLKIAIDIFYNELDIEISTTEDEKKNVYKRSCFKDMPNIERSTPENEKNGFDESNGINNKAGIPTSTATEGPRKVYFLLWNNGVNKHGEGSRNYGSYRPIVLKFGNLSRIIRGINTYAVVNGRNIKSTFVMRPNKTLYFLNRAQLIYAHESL
jgi:hypothetical protein